MRVGIVGSRRHLQGVCKCLLITKLNNKLKDLPEICPDDQLPVFCTRPASGIRRDKHDRSGVNIAPMQLYATRGGHASYCVNLIVASSKMLPPHDVAHITRIVLHKVFWLRARMRDLIPMLLVERTQFRIRLRFHWSLARRIQSLEKGARIRREIRTNRPGYGVVM